MALFESNHNLYFGSYSGAYSVLTKREYYDSQLTLTDHEFKVANSFFGGDIHSGAVRENPEAAIKQFVRFPDEHTIWLNLIYPKPSKDELRLYLSMKRGFKPKIGEIWFLFERAESLFVGSMTRGKWTETFNCI